MVLTSHLLPMWLVLALAAAPPDEELPVRRWGVWQLLCQTPQDITPDAVQDVELVAEMTSPSGKEHTVPGFWDGGRTWKVRFMPDEVGTWVYSTVSRPVLGGVGGRGGTFRCVDVKDGG